jgi:hypothetical protein
VFNSWVYYDNIGTKMVIYISYIEVTLIILLEADQKNGSYRVFNVQRFDTNGVDTGNNASITKPNAAAPTTAPTATANATATATVPTNNNMNFPESKQNMMQDYFQWYNYWAKQGKNDALKHNNVFSEDYMLKTQIVPPVCPACPPTTVCSSKKEKCAPCPACARCPQPDFRCKKVPNYGSSSYNSAYYGSSGGYDDTGNENDNFTNNSSYLPVPVLNDFSTFGS